MSCLSICAPRHGRRAALREAKRRLEQEADGEELIGERVGEEGERSFVAYFDEGTIERASGRGRRRWFVEAKKQLDEHRHVEARPVPRLRAARLLEAERRMRAQLVVEAQANEAYEQYIRGGVTLDGQRFRAKPAPYVAPGEPAGVINLTDPDSRMMQTWPGWIQAYNAQAADLGPRRRRRGDRCRVNQLRAPRVGRRGR